jgi:chemotaxis protein histidine kinase CheA
MSRTADLTAALRSGGVAVYERVKDAQDAAAASQATLTKKVEEYIKARAPEVGAAQAEEEAAAKRAGWALDIQRAADAEKALNRELDATKKAEAEAEAAAKRRATAAATAAKQAEEKTNKNALALQASFDDFWEKAEGRAEERAGKTADAANKAMAKGLVELEQENSKQRAQEANNATDRIVRYAGSAFADMFRDGKKNWSEMWANFFGVARATLARIVAEAALRPIIQPIVLSVMGGDSGGAIVSSALGSGGGITQSTGGGGMFSGLTGSIGQSVAGKWVADQLGISGMSLGQIGSSLGITSSATAAPSLAGMSTSEALASLPATPTAASTGTGIYALGPVGGIAGGVGLGMLGGSIVGGMRGSVDASRNSAIGGMIGAGVGAFFGPVGSLVGGALGGAVGGLFGPTKKGMEERSGGNVIWGIGENGQLSITSAQGKRWDQAGATSETQGKLDAINAAAAARGLTFGGSLTTQQRNIGFGEGAARAGWSNALNEAAVVGLLQSGNTNVQTALNASRSGTLEQALSNVDFVTQVYEPLQKDRRRHQAIPGAARGPAERIQTGDRPRGGARPGDGRALRCMEQGDCHGWRGTQRGRQRRNRQPDGADAAGAGSRRRSRLDRAGQCREPAAPGLESPTRRVGPRRDAGGRAHGDPRKDARRRTAESARGSKRRDHRSGAHRAAIGRRPALTLSARDGR